MTLYEIGKELEALAARLSEAGGEITDDEAGVALEEWFAQLGEQRDQKIDNYAALIREFEARAEMREAEAKRLLALAATDNNNAQRLKARLQVFFADQGITKLETNRFRLSMHKNGGKAPLIVPEEWEREPARAPEAFHRLVIQLNKEEIRGVLEAGDEVQGCRIAERGSHLRIK
jgi:hypothetical protein